MLSTIINNWKNIQHQNEKTMIKQDQQEQLSIMTEENYYDVKYMLDSFECIVDGDFCTINQSKEDDSLAEDVKCLKDISYNHGCNQYSTIETLNLVKSKLEDHIVQSKHCLCCITYVNQTVSVLTFYIVFTYFCILFCSYN
jgi:hypothetical protein